MEYLYFRWEAALPTTDAVMNLLANDGLLLFGGSADPPDNNQPSLAERLHDIIISGRSYFPFSLRFLLKHTFSNRVPSLTGPGTNQIVRGIKFLI